MKQNITVAITVYGKVQGVGFRPLVCRLAKKNNLTGTVCNAGTHVEITASGLAADIEAFCESLRSAALPVRVEQLSCKKIASQEFASFVSVESAELQEVKCVPADIGICENCLRELNEKQNRRAGYAYISCAQCGPRYTIIRKLPYDRNNTTMDAYALCGACAAEYHNMEDRRGHGETISCYHCGPQLTCFAKNSFQNFNEEKTNSKKFFDKHLPAQKNKTAASVSDEKILALARELLCNGQIIMVKAVGGFNLLCRADRTETVTRLRDLKKRVSKPFAVMVSTVSEAETLCFVSPKEKELLESEARPIVLLQKKNKNNFSIAKNKMNDCSELKTENDDANHFAANANKISGCVASNAKKICDHVASNAKKNSGHIASNTKKISGHIASNKKEFCDHVAPNVTDVSDQLGVFLPSMGFYASLSLPFPVIVTSCNYAGEPILFKEEEAFRFYEAHDAIAALFTYDREILRPADDAVARVILNKPQLLRRAKGYMPEAVPAGKTEIKSETESVPLRNKHCLQNDHGASSQRTNNETPNDDTFSKTKIVAVGAEMKPGFCLAADGKFFPAEIPGDITLERTECFFEESVQDWMRLLNIRPETVVADLHPGYASAQWGKQFAEQNGLPFYRAQHHHAHALAVMAEHGLQGKTLAVCFDGTGLGDDGTVWGGEFLLCEGAAYQRAGHLKPVVMLGGDASMPQAWKTAMCHLAAAGMSSNDPRFAVVKAALKQKINCIETTSMGRLFDAAASMLGLADFNSHEGRCAMALEAAAREALLKKIAPLPLSFVREEKNLNCEKEFAEENKFVDADDSLRQINIEKQKSNQKKEFAAKHKIIYDPASIWRALCNKPLADCSEKEECDPANAESQFADKPDKNYSNNEFVCAAALGFHYAVCDMVVDMAETMGVKQIVLAGGCFANRILLETCFHVLQQRGFLVYYNEKVSPGDGGITLGQAYYGMLRKH